MKRTESPLLTGILGALLAGSIAAACGSDAQHKNERRQEGGAGGLAGASADSGGASAGSPVAPGGAGGVPQPLAGAGGEPSVGGVPAVPMGGVGGVPAEGGAGGVPDTLPPLDCSTIVFKDAGLEQAVRSAIGKATGDITPADVATLDTLFANGFQVTLLDGIGCLPALTTLNLGIGGQASNVSDLSPLVYLENLKDLNLEENPLGDLTPLGKLPNLQTLSLDYSIKGNDLTPLGNAKSLTVLSMSNDTVGDLTPLSKIPALATLDMKYSTLKAPTSIASLKNVSELTLDGSLGDAAPLKGLTQLKKLSVIGMPLKNPGSFSGLTNLENLNLQSAGLTSAAPFAKLTKLTNLSLDYNQISDLTPLTGLKALTVLTLASNTFTDLQPLVDNTGLGAGDSIWLTGVALTCMTETAKITALTDRGVSIFGATCP